MTKLNAMMLVLCLSSSMAACAPPPAPSAPMTLAPQKSNGSGIELRYRLEAAPQLGQAFALSLSFAGVAEATGATARFSGDAGLVLDTAGPVDLAQGRSSLTLNVTPSREGLFYVNVFLAQRGGRSAVSIPVQVGTGRAKAESAAAPEEPGIIVMPVK